MPVESLRTTENLKESSRIMVNFKDSLGRPADQPVINFRQKWPRQRCCDVFDDLDAVFGQFGQLFWPNWAVFLAFTKTVLTIWKQFLER